MDITPDPEYDMVVSNIIKNEIVPVDFSYKTYECKILRSPLGSLCGYINLPSDHPLHGKHYSDAIEVPLSILNREVDDMQEIGILSMVYDSITGNMDEGKLSISSCFNVHGGLTFSGDPDNKGNWWFGFDCAHAGDYVPACPMGGSYKEVYYVENQCKQLVEQMLKVKDWGTMI